MRYFDKILSEALSNIGPNAEDLGKQKKIDKAKKAKEKSKKPVEPWSDKDANDLLNKYCKDPENIELQARFEKLRARDPKEFARWHEKNSNNKDYQYALKHISKNGGEGLVTWMLRLLIAKAES